MKTWQTALGAICMVAGLAVTAAPLTLTGAELLVSPNVTFPTVTPALNGTSLVLGGGSHYAKLLSYGVDPTNNIPSAGEVTVRVIWNLTRLVCVGECSGGSDDWDPMFLLTDGSMMFGFQLADNSGGEVWTTSFTDLGTAGANWTRYGSQSGTGFPDLGSSISVSLDFTLHDDGLTAHVQYPNVDRSFTWQTPMARTSNLALLLVMDNDGGEQYQLNYMQFPDLAAVPEPSILALVIAAMVGIAATRRRSYPALGASTTTPGQSH